MSKEKIRDWEGREYAAETPTTVIYGPMMQDDTEKAIDEALEGKPRSGELAEMIAALEVRRETFERERAAATTYEARKSWAQRQKEVDRQIEMLRQEMAITDFVERTVRSAISRPRPAMDDDEY